MIALTVSRTIEGTNCDLDVAVAWTSVSKILLKLLTCLWKMSNFPNGSGDLLSAFENRTTSQRVTKNLNMSHSVRKILIKNEASFKLKLALKHQTRTNGDVTYNTRDIIFCKGKYIPI